MYRCLRIFEDGTSNILATGSLRQISETLDAYFYIVNRGKSYRYPEIDVKEICIEYIIKPDIWISWSNPKKDLMLRELFETQEYLNDV